MPSLSKSARSGQCPAYRKVGYTSTIVGLLHRGFGVIQKMSNNRNRQEKPIRTSASGSNADYHLKIEQVHKLIDACHTQREKLLIQLLAYTGIRRAEISELRISDILWDEHLLVIRHGKGDKQRLVPIPDSVLKGLKTVPANESSDPLFRSRKGSNLSCRQINRIVAQVGHRAGLRNPNPKRLNITCHLLRHTFARLWKQHKGSMESLSYILGHASQATTMDLYGKESIPEMRENYEEIYKKIEK